jgi:hypothetical protein
MLRQQIEIGDRLRNPKPTRSKQDDFRIGVDQVAPFQPAGMLTGLREQTVTTRDLDELWHPISACHERPEPLDGSDPRSRFGCRCFLADNGETQREGTDQLVSPFRNAKHLANAANVDPDIGESIRFQ